MASATKKSDSIRNRKQTGKGKVRKAKNRTNGTTRTMAELFEDEE